MPSPGFSTALRNSRADAIAAAVGSGGKVLIYNGTKPATGGAATTMLSTHTLSGAFAAAASNGVLTGNLPPDVNATNSGTGTWGRITTSGGTPVIDGTVGVAGSGANIIVNSTTFTAGVSCSVTSMVFTEGNV